jgi:NAD(P)-dependent dehydrogenase (short-subunit alcohol dehydrogenase family)
MAVAGWRVLAGVRKPGDAPPGTTEVILDITDPNAVAKLAPAGTDPWGLSLGLKGFVANAGIGIAVPLEDLPAEELRRQFEVNVIGQLAVTQAVLPALRTAGGRIVIMGSIGGRSALPFLGGYAMTKFALEAMADSLRLELGADGIDVSLVEPGTIATAIWTKPQPLADRVSDRYRARFDHFRRFAAARSGRAAPVELVAEAVEHALTAERPKTRYLVGRDAKIRATIERLPDRLRDRVLRRALLGD